MSIAQENKYKLLKINKYALSVGYALIFALIYVCLTPNPPDTSGIDFGDKIAHSLGYALLFLWFAQIYTRSSQIRVVIGLIILGIVVEVAQGFTAYRSFEYADMLANTVGVMIGWIIAATPIASILLQIEKRFI